MYIKNEVWKFLRVMFQSRLIEENCEIKLHFSKASITAQLIDMTQISFIILN